MDQFSGAGHTDHHDANVSSGSPDGEDKHNGIAGTALIQSSYKVTTTCRRSKRAVISTISIRTVKTGWV